ncbi:selenocysteine-specific translation elongation factor [Bacillus luteolus]|uniref:Selenocysteine-specific elongation factor n=1 Tax=Litchfieldia luteola TaxID=682179 RepID=A0ABR9QJD4_9BACI|nr:selenocysteine-specific translation elongation factor [Cytobacillus luteolus]MBE4908615.1 selenocysteine-specific translation elongation factor [Cytobacillus luteolus]MBP1941471.1 selenocysteine-specific elongation factor [Cytobacillus luteolus]
MEKRSFTIGMAGHIDHGKTTLTKALTNVDTDRLKEEKERQISIELGFAPLHINEEMQISVIDVPGHERFIRQMIAGVAGIDLVILVVAADEGVMPQTKEHLEILSFLGVKRGIVAISKIDRVEEEFTELVKEEIAEQLQGTLFADAPIVPINSLSKMGIDELKSTILNQLSHIEARNSLGSFRLPIDQVFTVKGQGTVVRGTVYEGTIFEGDQLTILPSFHETKARQLQIHQIQMDKATAGQRVAINLSNVTTDDVTRGDVLVSSKHYVVTQTMDVVIRFVSDLEHLVKQRALVKCHIGTSEVMGQIVFFDRNEVKDELDEVVCQIRLDQPIVTKRGDRFILRRPTPSETIAGGWVIDPLGGKYKFGKDTVSMLLQKKEGSPFDRLTEALQREKLLSKAEIIKATSLAKESVEELLSHQEVIEVKANIYTLKTVVSELHIKIEELLQNYHLGNSLRLGLNKAEISQELSSKFPKTLLDFVIEGMITEGKIKKNGQFIALDHFKPSFPSQWAKRMDNLINSLIEDNLQVKTWDEYVSQAGLPDKEANELKWFLTNSNLLYQLDEKHVIHKNVVDKALINLRASTGESFDLKDAKDTLQLSRKYLVPLLELLDTLNLTKREDNKRIWVEK